MSEYDAIQRADSPGTRGSLAADLRRLGLAPGMMVIVHSSLSALGWVAGGPVAVVQALLDVLTPEGTLVMPAHSSDYSEPSHWQNPPVPPDWWPVIRESMPAFEPAVTPTRQMGAIVETFRTWPGTRRSSHPASSFAAWGKHAEYIVAGHTLDHSMGEGSPLARIYDVEGWVLLLGVGFDNNTSFHLAEYRVPEAIETEEGAPILEDGKRVWRTYRDIELDADVFPEIGVAYERTGLVRTGGVGSGEAKLFPQRPAVDFAVRWLAESRREARATEA